MSAEAPASANRFVQAEQDEILPAASLIFELVHEAKPSVSLADILVPEYWARVTRTLSPGHGHGHVFLKCFARDCSWFAELLVRSVGAEGAVVMMLRGGPLEGQSTPPGAFTAEPVGDLEITYEGPFLRWCVKAQDGRTMKSNLDSQQQAVNWIATYRRTVRT